jgi:CRISPR-associated endonuclease/helicase Cas3
MLLAKSAGIGGRAETLFDHSRSVVQMARQLYARLPSVVKSQDGLMTDLEAAAAVHDIGKAASGFQEMLQGMKPHWNAWRHEVLSAAFASRLHLPEEVVLAVLTHHRQIPGRPASARGRLLWHDGRPEDWSRLYADWLQNERLALDFWKQLCVELGREDLLNSGNNQVNEIALDAAWLDYKITRRQSKFIPSERRLRACLLRGLLIGADHLASAGIEIIPPPVDITVFSPSFPLRDFQASCAVPGHVILLAPTGSGKTEAALIWAGFNQSENGRFFYALPYTAALNAMHGRVQREFPEYKGSIGLLHGRAAHHLYEAAQQDYPAEAQRATAEALARARLAHEMYHPVRICTPHQLLRFTLRGKGWEQMLSEIPGSCIVFDEIHSYDSALSGLTLGTARLFASMSAHLMFVSATLPRFLQDIILQIIPCSSISPNPDSDSDREVLDRKRHVVRLVDQSLLDLLPQIEEAVKNGLRVLVVCNHVRSAHTVAVALRKTVGEGEDRVCLFHGRFNMKDRKTKEAALASKSLPNVLVATQVVEVSLDISFDIGFFEAAPIDALAQRMGRVNRRGNKENRPALVFVARRPINKHQLYDSERTVKTLESLAERTGPLAELDLLEICNCVYRQGYVGEDKTIFEERLNHKLLVSFQDEVIAGQHQDWIDAVIEKSDGRADVLPMNLQSEYQEFIQKKLWLDADALLVNVYVSSVSKFLDKTTDPWIVRLPYGRDGLEAGRVRH